MKSFILAVAFGLVAVTGFAGEAPTVIKEYPVQSYSTLMKCENGRCCANGQCFVREPRFERSVNVSTTCDACGVKEHTRTVTRTRRRR